jgi:hypothetical protein
VVSPDLFPLQEHSSLPMARVGGCLRWEVGGFQHREPLALLPCLTYTHTHILSLLRSLVFPSGCLQPQYPATPDNHHANGPPAPGIPAHGQPAFSSLSQRLFYLPMRSNLFLDAPLAVGRAGERIKRRKSGLQTQRLSETEHLLRSRINRASLICIQKPCDSEERAFVSCRQTI